MITFYQYQEEVNKAAFYPEANSGSLSAILYGALGLNGEAGEVAEKVKKVWRDKESNFDNDALEIAKELGDALWYITRIGAELGYSLDKIAQLNVDKIVSRRKNGTFQGSGDNR